MPIRRRAVKGDPMSQLYKHTPKFHERVFSDSYSLWMFYCPACGHGHAVPVGRPGDWTFNGKIESPTLTPSVRNQTNEKTDGTGRLPEGQLRTSCHLNITDGKIIYCADNPHEFNGKTVPMVDFPEGYGT